MGRWNSISKNILSESAQYDYFGTDITYYGNDLIATAPKSTDKPERAYLISLNLAQSYWGTDAGSGVYNETNIVRVGVRTKSNNDGFGSSIQIGPNYGIVGAIYLTYLVMILVQHLLFKIQEKDIGKY